MNEITSLRVFLYIRVSTQEQAKEGYSIGAQEERLRAYAKAKGYTVVKVYTDPAYSGANMERPALQELIKQIEQGSADLVLVYKLDRLSRSQRDTLYLIEEVFLKNNVDFVSMNESFDTSTPFGRAMIGILSVFAQLEREQIRERSMMGREARAKSGKWSGNRQDRIVTGYDYVNGLLVINEYNAACVKMIFNEFYKGSGVNKVFRLVNTKYPGVINNESTVRKILRNPIYIGKIKHRGTVYEGVHEAIISEEMFQSVQTLIEKKTPKSETFKHTYLLSGIIYCGHCGAKMFGRTGGRLKNGDGMRYYNCYSRAKRDHLIKDINCIKQGERKEPLEQYIIDEIKKINLRFVENYNTSTTNIIEKAEPLHKELVNIDKQITKLIDLYSLDDAPLDMINQRMTKLKENRTNLLKHIAEIESNQSQSNLEEIKETISQLANFDWNNQETELEKRLIVAKLINKIIVFNDHINIEWAF